MAKSPYVKVPEWILGLNLKPEALGVYCQIRSYLNHKSGQCYPSVSTVAAVFGVSHDYIQKRLAELEAVGALRIFRISGRSSGYGFPEEPHAAERVVGE